MNAKANPAAYGQRGWRAVMLGLSTVMLVALLFSGLEQLRDSQRRMVDRDLIADVEKIMARLEHQLTQSRLYLANAPRDYDSYYRDVRLYYPLMLSDRTVIDELMQRLQPDAWATRRGNTFVWRRKQALEQALERWRTLWRGQRMEIVEQLGDTQAEPRLEWGAEALSDGLPALLAQAREVLDRQAKLQTGEQRLANLSHAVVVLSLLGLAGGMVWQRWRYRAVRRRLSEHLSNPSGDTAWYLLQRAARALDEQHASARLMAALSAADRIDDWPTVILRYQPATANWLWCAVLERLSPGDDPGEARGLWRVVSHGGTLAASMLQTPLLRLDEGTLEHNRWQRLDRLGERSPLDTAGEHTSLALLAHDGRRLLVLVAATSAPDALAGLERWGGAIAGLMDSTSQAVAEIPVQSVFHELRNPLTGMQLAIEGLREGGEEQQERWMALLERDQRRVVRLLNDLRDQGGGMRLALRSLDLGRWLSGYFSARDEPPIVLSGLPACVVMLDVDRFGQVMDNLLRNAVEAHGDASAPLRFEMSLDAGWVRLQLCNAGGPLPDALQRQGVQPFLTTKADGTGLGLLISQQLVQAHGGHLRLFDSEDEPGWVVAEVSLPRLPARH